MKRLRKVFLVVSALGYGFLGGGPSLWALGLKTAPPAACAAMDCTCAADGHSEGAKACCCRIKQNLLKKFPQIAQEERAARIAAMLEQAAPASAPADALPSSGPALRGGACSPFAQDLAGHTLPPMPPHLAVLGWVFKAPAQAAGILQAPSSFRSYAPEPPTPIPD